MSLTNCLDILALLIQIFGTVFMFWNSPDNKVEGGFIFAGNPDLDIPKKRNRKLQRGFQILCLGFIVQFFSLLLKIIIQ